MGHDKNWNNIIVLINLHILIGFSPSNKLKKIKINK